MKNEVLKSIQELSNLIIQNGYENGYKKIHFWYIQTLNIVYYELSSENSMSDLTGEAISQLSTFQAVEYFKTDFPDVYQKCIQLSSDLKQYNNKLQNYELGVLGVKDANWIKYFNQATTRLMNLNPPNN